MTEELTRVLIGVAVAIGAGLLGLAVRKVAARQLGRLLRRTRTDLDDVLLAALMPQVPFWFLMAGVLAGTRYAQLDPTITARIDKFALAAFVFSVTLATAAFLTQLVSRHDVRLPGGLPTTSLTQNVIRIAVVGLGALVVLGNLGIAIAPLLTALGVGSLAVALALQPTLSNLFAGFHISLARRIRVGDYVELETGQQGYVTDITWRSTQIRELPNNLVIVPNARLAEVIVRNFSLPENEQAALVQVGVSYGSDLAEVERVTIETAREIQRTVKGGIAEFEPFIRYNTFGDSSINFTVILRVREFVDRYLMIHEFVKLLHRRYAEAGIEIPFPQRVIHLPQPVQVADGH